MWFFQPHPFLLREILISIPHTYTYTWFRNLKEEEGMNFKFYWTSYKYTMISSWQYGVLINGTLKVLLLRPIIFIINIDVGIKLVYQIHFKIKMKPEIDNGRRQNTGPLMLGQNF